MTTMGPLTSLEHEAEAERLKTKAHDLMDQAEGDPARERRALFVLERAKVHASLSVAAAVRDVDWTLENRVAAPR